jgi:nucleosome binding factor SPN SPT16 subunit
MNFSAFSQRRMADEQGLGRMQTEQFYFRVKKLSDEFSSLIKNIYYVQSLFMSGESIWPDQCEYATTTIQGVSKQLKMTIQIFKKKDSLPLSVVSTRQGLIVKMAYLDNQVSTLLILVAELRASYESKPIKLSSRQNDVLRKLNDVLANADELIRTTDRYLAQLLLSDSPSQILN